MVRTRNVGKVTKAYLDSSKRLIYEIQALDSEGFAPRRLDEFKIFGDVLKSYNSRRRSWDNETERTKNREKQEEHLMNKFGIHIS